MQSVVACSKIDDAKVKAKQILGVPTYKMTRC
jgi:hypothetical protein